MSHSILANIIEQLDSLSLDEKRVLSEYLASLNKQESVINRSKVKVIESKKINISELANDYGASNIRYLIEDKEVIFIVDLDRNRSLFDLGGVIGEFKGVIRI